MLPLTHVTQTEVLPTRMLIIISNECRCVSVVVGGDYDDDGDDRDSSL